MSDIVIHNIRVSYDETDERVRDFVKYLRGEGRKEELREYHNKALQVKEDNKIYLSDRAGNEFTFKCTREHNCTLGFRGSGYND